MTRPQRAVIAAWSIAATIGVDQLTKWMSKLWLKGRHPIIVGPDLFRFQYAENPGAFLSLGDSLPDWARFAVFVVLVSIGLLALLWMAVFGDGLRRWETIGLSLMVGGGVSNLIDRLAYDGIVVDFMNCGIGWLRTGIFNVADMAILAGAGIFFVMRWRASDGKKKPKKKKR